jgi:hypothetical protein
MKFVFGRRLFATLRAEALENSLENRGARCLVKALGTQTNLQYRNVLKDQQTVVWPCEAFAQPQSRDGLGDGKARERPDWYVFGDVPARKIIEG